MTFPTEADFVKVSIGDGATTEVFTLLCGIENVSINQTVNTNQRARRDCAKPGLLAQVRNVPISKQWEATGSGVWNLAQVPLINTNLGIDRNYLFEFGRRDGTDTGVIIGQYKGKGLMTAMNATIGDDGSAEMTIAGNSDIVWTAVP